MNLDGTAKQLLTVLAEARQGFVGALPDLITALIVLILGWWLAWTLRRVVRRIFARLVGQMPAGTTRAEWNEAVDQRGAGDIAATGVYWLVLLTAFLVAIDALGFSVFSKWLSAFAIYLPRIVIAMALVFGGVVASRLAGNAIKRTAVRLPPSQARSLARLAQVAIVVATVLIAAEQLGVDVSLLTEVFLIVLAAALAGAALAFGLGAREVMADILAMHYVHKSYRIGQLIRIGPDQGRIVRTNGTTVFLENADGELAIPGRHFVDDRCLILNQEDDHGP